MKTIKFLIIPVLLMALIIGCGPKEPSVAKIGREYVTVEEFKTEFLKKHRSESSAMSKSYADRERMVHELALPKAKYMEGVAQGLDQQPEIVEQVERLANRKALDLLYKTKIVDAVITEDAIEKFYEKSAKEVNARHILLKTAPDADSAEVERVRVRIDSIKTAIEGGLDFKTAAKLYSEDATSAADSGALGWFPWGRMVDPFQEAAWDAKAGEVAGPVQTNYGFHLIQVEETRPVEDRRPLEEMRDRIKDQLVNVESQKLGQAARDFVDKLHKDWNLEYNTENLSVFIDKLKDPTLDKTKELSPYYTEEQKALEVATYRGGKVTVADLIEKVGANAHRVDWTNEQVPMDLVHSIVEPKFLEEEAAREGLLKEAEKDPDVVMQKRNAVISALEKAEVADKIDPTEDEWQAYYESHLDQYIQPEMRLIREIFIKEDSVKAARVRGRALQGEDFKRLAWRYNEKESTKADTGRIGPFPEKRFGLIGKTAFKLEEIGDISEVVRVGNNFAVVQLLDITPERTKTFEEAKTSVGRDYRRDKTAEYQDELDKYVLDKWKLKIYEDKLAEVWPLPETSTSNEIAREP